MKNPWILLSFLVVFSSAQGSSLDDKIKTFTEALKATSSDKTAANPLLTQRMLGMPDQLESFRAPGGEANMETIIRQIMASTSDPAVQQAGKDLLSEIESEKKTRVDALTAQLDSILKPVSDLLLKAHEPKELDDTLSDLQKIQITPSGMYGLDPESQAVMNRVNSSYQFVAQWQDYLSDRNSGKIQEAQNTLRNLANSRQPGESILVPRSEILARADQLVVPVQAMYPAAATDGAFATEESSILAGIKTLEDLEPALNRFKSTPNQSFEIAQLSQLANAYAAAKNGLPINLDLSPQNFGGGNPAPGFERIKSMVLLYLVPRFIGPGALPPNSDEGVVDYLKRSMDDAESKQDLTAIRQIVEVEMAIAPKVQIQVYPSGAHTFLSGLNQDMAGQYALATNSYQSALKQPEDYLPLKVAEDRLAAIKKDHPLEYEAGMKNFLNPPTPAYVNPYGARVGMVPGYPYPGFGYPAPVNPTAITRSAPFPATNSAPVAPPH